MLLWSGGCCLFMKRNKSLPLVGLELDGEDRSRCLSRTSLIRCFRWSTSALDPPIPRSLYITIIFFWLAGRGGAMDRAIDLQFSSGRDTSDAMRLLKLLICPLTSKISNRTELSFDAKCLFLSLYVLFKLPFFLETLNRSGGCTHHTTAKYWWTFA